MAPQMMQQGQVIAQQQAIQLQQVSAIEGSNCQLPIGAQVHQAFYSQTNGPGGKEVTSIVQQLAVQGTFPVNNSTMQGDPVPGQPKQLVVTYSVGTAPVAQILQGGQMMMQGVGAAVQQGGMMMAQAINQSGTMPYGGQVAPMPVASDPYNQLVGYAYPPQEALNYVRMLDGALNISDGKTSFDSFQSTINNILMQPGGSVGLLSVLSFLDPEQNGHWSIYHKVLIEDPCFMEFLIATNKRYDPSMTGNVPRCAPESGLNCRDRFGYPPFVRACEKGQVIHAQMLFEAGVDRHATVTGTTKNALDCAAEKGHSKMVRFLKDRNLQSNQGCCVIV